MYIPHVINEKSLTVFINGKGYPMSSSHVNFNRVKGLLISGDHDQVPDLLSIKTAIIKAGGGDIEIDGSIVKYNGRRIDPFLEEKLISMIREGHKQIEPFKNYIRRILSNISLRAQEQFPKFASYKELPIDEEGFVYAFKGVKGNDFSCMGNVRTRVYKGIVDEGGHILNSNGAEIECDRADVDDDPTKTCSQGLHAGSLDFARGWGEKIKMIKFDPADVVAVPIDEQCQKIRLCHYWVIGDYKEEPIKAVITKDSTVPVKKTKEEYREKFCSLAKKFKIGIDEFDFMYQTMSDLGYCDMNQVREIFEQFVIAYKINRYVEKNGGEAPYKRIQSALKSYKLKYEDIERLLNDFGQIFD